MQEKKNSGLKKSMILFWFPNVLRRPKSTLYLENLIKYSIGVFDCLLVFLRTVLLNSYFQYWERRLKKLKQKHTRTQNQNLENLAFSEFNISISHVLFLSCNKCQFHRILLGSHNADFSQTFETIETLAII